MMYGNQTNGAGTLFFKNATTYDRSELFKNMEYLTIPVQSGIVGHPSFITATVMQS